MKENSEWLLGGDIKFIGHNNDWKGVFKLPNGEAFIDWQIWRMSIEEAMEGSRELIKHFLYKRK